MPKSRKQEKPLYDSEEDIFTGEGADDEKELKVEEKQSRKAKVSKRSKRTRTPSPSLSTNSRASFASSDRAGTSKKPLTNVKCTSCSTSISPYGERKEIYEHPKLHVVICKKCYKKVTHEEMTEKDDEGFDVYCAWCGDGGALINCESVLDDEYSCQKSFCESCLKRNLGRDFVSKVKDVNRWECILCKPFSLYDLQQKHKEFFQAQKNLSEKFSKSEKTQKEKKKEEKIKQSMEILADESKNSAEDKKNGKNRKEKIEKISEKIPKATKIFERLISTTKQLGTIYSKVFTTYKDTVRDLKSKKIKISIREKK